MIKQIEAIIRDNFPPKLVLKLIVFKKRFFGDPEIKLLPKLLSGDKSNGVDVGAYRGLFSYHLAKYCTNVYTYEANPFLANWLEKAVPGNVEVRNIGISNKNQQMTFAIPIKDGKTQDSRASLEVRTLSDNVENVKEIEVQVERLDDQNLSGIGFVKIDVEGHERAAIEGAKELIAENKPVLFIEIEQRHNYKPIEETFLMIEEMGYESFYYLKEKLHSTKTFDKKIHQRVDENNTIATNEYINNFFFIPTKRLSEIEDLIVK